MHNKNSLIRYKIFEPFNNLLAFTTTKQTFMHPDPRFTGDEPVIYGNNRKNLATLLNIDKKQLIFPRQTHSDRVVVVLDFPKWELNETDALVTNKPGFCLCVQTADCVPVLLFDPANSVIAIVHAGWRGTVKTIAAKAVKQMIVDFNCSPKNIVAVIGPSICPEVYEIGDEVISAVEKQTPVLKSALIENHSGKTHFNLWEANRIILTECGLQEDNIEIPGECSYILDTKYFSARREGIKTGRIVSGIMLLNI